MNRRDSPMSQNTLFSLLQECTNKKDLIAARKLHSMIISNALVSVSILGDYLIRLFAACGNLLEANLVFCMIATPTIYTWHAIIAAHVTHGDCSKALELYHRMQQDGIKPNNHVFTCILKACGTIGAIEQGKLIHNGFIMNGHESDLFITSTLVDMYAKCGSIQEAHKVLNDMPERDVVSCSTLLAGYVQHGYGFCAIELLEEMQREGIEPDKVMLVSVLKACSSIGYLELGKLLHDQIMRMGLEFDVIVGNTLVDMYANCDSLKEAREVFEKLQNQTIVSWGVMIAGYANHGHGFLALELLEKMGYEDIKPNKVILLCSLKACGSIGAMDEGNLVYNHIVQNCFESDAMIGSALTDMYAKCMSLEDARKVFDKMPSQNVVSWGAMIAGYAEHGHALHALALFERMQQKGITPAKVTFLCMLKACGSVGLLEKVKQLHEQVVRRILDLDEDIGNTLVDVYGKCESLEDAHKVFDQLENQSAVSWSTIITGYTLHGHGLHALELFERMQQDRIKPDTVLFFSLLKACGSTGALKKGKTIHKQIVTSGLEGDVAVGNALIDMYAKSCSLEDACKVFDEMLTRDVVTWGTMITGYAQHGNYKLAGHCLEVMQQHGFKPNCLTFTSLLAACSQLGKVLEGDYRFESMREDHAIKPSVEHFTCMINLFAGAGHLKKAKQLLQSMPSQGDITGWICLLTACKTYGSIDLGQECFNEIVSVDPNTAAGYILMADIYADANMWDDAYKMYQMRKYARANKKPGVAWIEAEKSLHEFSVEDKFHSLSENIYANIKALVSTLKEEGYVPHLDLLSESPKLCALT